VRDQLNHKLNLHELCAVIVNNTLRKTDYNVIVSNSEVRKLGVKFVHCPEGMSAKLLLKGIKL